MPKISGLPPDTSPLVSDIVPMVDNTAIVTKKVLLSDLITTIFNNAPPTSTSGWNTLAQAFTYGSNVGNREFTITTPNDVSGLLWPGMRMKFNRGTTPPTQSMAFASGSSQYARKTTPTGLSFTTAFTCECWLYLNSYTGVVQWLGGQRNNVSGTFGLRLEATGTVGVLYGDGSGNLTDIVSYQSVPLNRWIHIAGVVSSVAGQSGSIYFDGALVPTTFAVSSAFSLVHSGDFSLGGDFTGSYAEFLNGYMSEFRVWSNAQSQAQILSNMTKNLAGNEANLVGLWEGNGNFNDLTSNGNNLTQSGGAIATQASNPYNATEYAIITKVSYVNPTATITLFTGNAGTIPNMTLGSPQYSSVRAPYGFPNQTGVWQVTAYMLVAGTAPGATSGPWYNVANFQLSIPTGEWDARYSLPCEVSSTGTGTITIFATLSTSSSAETDKRFTTSAETTDTSHLENTLTAKADISLSSATTYYGLLKFSTTSTTFAAQFRGDYSTVIINARCSYL